MNTDHLALEGRLRRLVSELAALGDKIALIHDRNLKRVLQGLSRARRSKGQSPAPITEALVLATAAEEFLEERAAERAHGRLVFELAAKLAAEEEPTLGWYAAHLVFAAQGSGTVVAARESVVLVSAASLADALHQAIRVGARADGQIIQLPQGKFPIRFVGARKLAPIGGELVSGTEITAINLELDDDAALERLCEGGFVKAVVDW